WERRQQGERQDDAEPETGAQARSTQRALAPEQRPRQPDEGAENRDGMPEREQTEVTAQLEAEGAAQRRGAAESDLPTEQVRADGPEREVEEGDDEQAAVDIEREEYEVQGVEGAGRRCRREGLAAVLEAVPEEAVARAQAAELVDEVRIGRRVDVGRRDAGASGHQAEDPPGGREDEQHERQHPR